MAEALKPAGDTPTPGRFETPTLEELTPLFPQYELLELIGRGGMGAVYKVLDKKLDRFVALKVLPRELATDPSFEERFVREARALARLQHAGIIGVQDFGVVEGLSYLALEYVEGQTLRALMRETKLAPERVAELIRCVVEALNYAHAQGVIHRDIKPENLLIDGEGRVRIADFGLARLTLEGDRELSITGTGHALGTPHYMAPEQLEAPEAVDERCDLFAIGVLWFELLTGSLPLGVFSLPDDVGEPTRSTLMRCLQREPDQRFASASELLQAMEARHGTSVPSKASEGRRGSSQLYERYLQLIFAGLIIGIGSFLPWGQLHSDFGTISLSAWNGNMSIGPIRIPNWIQTVLGAGILASGIWLRVDPKQMPRAFPLILTVIGDVLAFLMLFFMAIGGRQVDLYVGLFVVLAGYQVAGHALWQTRSRAPRERKQVEQRAAGKAEDAAREAE